MTDLMIAGLSSGLVLAAMAAMAVLDARRAVVDPRLVLALLAAAAVWRYLSPDGNSPWTPWTGMALGIAAVALPIIVAQWRGRRWPLYPGDAMMLGAFGFLLGPIGLAWTMLLGSAFSLAYRVWVQRRRGRRIRKGLVPLGPGMTAGAAVVFLCVNFGVAFAAGEPPPHGVPAVTGAAATVTVFPLPNSRGRKSCSRRRNWLRPAPRCPRQLPLGIWCSNKRCSFLAGCTPAPVFPVGHRDGDRGAPGADRRRDGDPVRCAADPPGLAGRPCRSARPARGAERLRLDAGGRERSSSTAIGISNNAPRLLALPIGLMKSHRTIRGSSRRGRTRPCAACSRAGRARRVGRWSGTPPAITPWDRVRSRPATLYFAVGFWRRSISCWPGIRPAALCRRSPTRRTAIW